MKPDAEWWAEREQTPEHLARVAEWERECAESGREADRALEPIERALAADPDNRRLQEQYNQAMTLDACITGPPIPSAKDLESNWLDYFREKTGRELPLHAAYKAESHRIKSAEPPDINGWQAAYDETHYSHIDSADLAAEWRGISVDELLREREREMGE
jgi:hypothetical protein